MGSGIVSNAIRDNKPLQISVRNSSTAHAVVISGVIIYENAATYIIVDPNISSKVYQDVTNAEMSDASKFVYYGQKTYTDWYRTFV